MEKYIYDESNGLWYELQGDYYIMEWVGRMNNIRQRVLETVNADLIFKQL